VHTRSQLFWLPSLAVLATTSACAFSALGSSQKDGLEQVDDLLAHVERVHVESAVGKDRSQAAFEGLRRLIAPEFKGDPASAHAELVAAVEQSEEQADALRSSVKPLRRTAESVFERWTADLESFGNLTVRQRSQERLEETRRRYDAVLAASVAAQLAFDAFNSDVSDHALFLEHDFNSASVALVAQELDGLRTRGKELARRLDACAAACQSYVEFSAPSAQLAPGGGAGGKAGTPSGAPPKPAPKKKPDAPATGGEPTGG
jgi:hypothetical protein